mgnify:CR=1 FL=1
MAAPPFGREKHGIKLQESRDTALRSSSFRINYISGGKSNGREQSANPHIGAQAGEIAETILLPGDPLRAKYIADNFLTDVKQFNGVRNMFGYTGYYKGKRVSVMGTGMGCPSIGIYSYELIHFYGCKNLIRVGTAGALQENVKIRDLVIGMGACITSNYVKQFRLPGDTPASAAL